jgi:DNA polymerase-3 subunit gamma/tau
MWDIKYRPARFTDVLGQEGAVQVLKARLAKKTALDTSYIFSGGHGQGKTTLARILSRAMLCTNLTADFEPCNECDNCKDALAEESAAFSEMDSASRGTIDYARALVDSLAFVVPGAPKKVFIFDEVHRMSRDAQDVLLKPLEDKKMVGVFCTTEPEKIRGPIRSRCEQYPIRKVTREDVLKRMKMVLEQENVAYEDDAVLTVIDHAGGHVRDVLNKLEMIGQLGPITLESVRSHLNLSVVSAYYRVLLSLADPAKAVQMAEEAAELVGPGDVAEGLAEAAMNAYRLANGMFAEFSLVDRELCKQVYDMYGDATLRFAEHFLRSYKVSKVGLFNDILACRAGAPARAAASTPVLVQVAVAPTPSPLTPTPAPAVAPSVSVISPVAAQAPAPAPAAKIEPAKTNGSGLRADGIGNRGSRDPQALTDLDTKGVPLTEPRGGHEQPRPSVPQGLKEEFLTIEEWKRQWNLRAAVFGIKGEA